MEARPSLLVQWKDGGTPVAKCERLLRTSEMTSAPIVDKTCISVPGWKAETSCSCPDWHGSSQSESPVLRTRFGQWSDVWLA
mmetsp:Transcript_46288/g.64308  ORF Transcript_46288/g.64308 Transcript_46288/m.64308 type:complete len:82 (-) Transcript_46288:141-386(-)